MPKGVCRNGLPAAAAAAAARPGWPIMAEAAAIADDDKRIDELMLLGTLRAFFDFDQLV